MGREGKFVMDAQTDADHSYSFSYIRVLVLLVNSASDLQQESQLSQRDYMMGFIRFQTTKVTFTFIGIGAIR